MIPRFCFLILLFSVLSSVRAQYFTNGSATASSPTCYTLTPAQNSQSGSVWYANMIDLTQSFEFSADIFLGCNNGGADGMVFAFQAVNTSVGSVGGGMGYSGISPSFAVEFDTYQNGNSGDPFYDHCAIISQGNVNHNAATNLAGPIGILPNNGNIEDCQWHSLHISWDPVNMLFRVYVDCILRLSWSGDMVTTIFGGNPQVFWGFTAGTGALNNQHQFCYNYISYGLNTNICQGDSIPLTVGGGASYSWSPVAGLSDPNSPNPIASPDTSTQYICTITDLCGFKRTEYFNITVYDTLAPVSLGPDTVLCQNDSFLLDMSQTGADYLWQDGSTDSIFWVNAPGTYWVELTTGCDTIRDSLIVQGASIPQPALGPDPTYCEGDSIWVNPMTANATSYLWQDGSDSSQFQITGPGLVWLVASNQCGSASDSLQVNYLPVYAKPDLGADTILCDNAALSISLNLPGATYLWSDNTTANNITIMQGGTYWVAAVNQCSAVSDTIDVQYELTPVVDLGADSTLCDGQSLLLDIGWTSNTSYLWQDGNTASTYLASQAGIYEVELTNACGFASDAIQLAYLSPPPTFSLGVDSTLCDNDQIILTGLPDYDYLWSDGSTASMLSVIAPGGLYWLELSNVCGSSRDSVRYEYLYTPQVDLGQDDILCEGEMITLDASWPGATYDWMDGLQTADRTIAEGGTYAVTVSNQCAAVQDEITFEYLPIPQAFSLGADQQLCEGDTTVLAEDQGADFQYLWQDGSRSPSYTVTDGGIYELTISNACGSESDGLNIRYLESPLVNLGNDTIICIDQARYITLDASFDQDVSYLWQDGSTESTYEVLAPGIYEVDLINTCGMASDNILIEPTQCFCAIHAPTGFTPNADGTNDEFRLFYECQITSGSYKVFDRWGRVVFASTGPDDVWDGTYQGKPSPEGVYVWVMDFTYTATTRTQYWEKSGTVTLLR